MNAVRLASNVARLILLLGIVAGLLTACGPASTTSPAAEKSQATPSARATPSSLHTALKTSDDKVQIQFSVTPNRLGTNKFLLDLKDVSSGKPVTDEQAQLFTTMLDMDMGTGVVLLQEDGNGRYSAMGDLPMDGNWDIHIQLVDNHAIHIAKLKIYTSA